MLVVGGGLSAVQFLLELEGIAQTTWATRRAPDFTDTEFDKQWGLDVEKKVRERVFSGNPPASVVSTTGIPPWQEYLDAVERRRFSLARNVRCHRRDRRAVRRDCGG